MDQVGQSGSGLMKSRLRERLVRSSHNAVACHAGVQDYPHFAFRHVAAGTIVWSLPLLSHAQRNFAAFVRVAASALSGEVRGSFARGRLHMRIVASNATERAAA